jgi:hypothetical protein
MISAIVFLLVGACCAAAARGTIRRRLGLTGPGSALDPALRAALGPSAGLLAATAMRGRARSGGVTGGWIGTTLATAAWLIAGSLIVPADGIRGLALSAVLGLALGRQLAVQLAAAGYRFAAGMVASWSAVSIWVPVAGMVGWLAASLLVGGVFGVPILAAATAYAGYMGTRAQARNDAALAALAPVLSALLRCPESRVLDGSLSVHVSETGVTVTPLPSSAVGRPAPEFEAVLAGAGLPWTVAEIGPDRLVLGVADDSVLDAREEAAASGGLVSGYGFQAIPAAPVAAEPLVLDDWGANQ